MIRASGLKIKIKNKNKNLKKSERESYSYWKLWGHFYCDVSIACGGFWFRGHLVNQLNDLKWQ